MSRAAAPAKINLALVVGPLRADGKHEVVTLLQAVGLADTIAIASAPTLEIVGFDGDTIVAAALSALAREAGAAAAWRVEIAKKIPVAAGLGGGSADAATALRLANETLPTPLSAGRLASLAATIGADVPFFLDGGSQLGVADGSELDPVALPLDYRVVLVLPAGVEKASTASVYAAFDARQGARGFGERRDALAAALRRVRVAADLGGLPSNDLASSPLAARLRDLGAFRADVSGAGPCVYGLFLDAEQARCAAGALASEARVWLTRPLATRATPP